MNVWSVIGRVGKDAVLRNAGDTPVLGWSLAVDAGYGDRKVTTWVDCSLWGKRAETLADKIAKGDRIAVTGEHSTREHDGKTYTTLKVTEVTLLGGKPQADATERGGGGGRSAPRPSKPRDDEPFPDEAIPFATNRSVW
jgi:single-strand DNA-binding protein